MMSVRKMKATIQGMRTLYARSADDLQIKPGSVWIQARTAEAFAGKRYGVRLHGRVYGHPEGDPDSAQGCAAGSHSEGDPNSAQGCAAGSHPEGDPDSAQRCAMESQPKKDAGKWVLLLHPHLLNGEIIARKVGPIYAEMGYHILAPDMRGFGRSKGHVALGFLESLDVYDWLCLLNKVYHAREIVVHGISLGAATTNFLSGLDQFMAHGPETFKPLKSLGQLHVTALIEDCGYTDMADFADRRLLLHMGIGLNSDNFDYYSKAVYSLKYCDRPMLILHGTGDKIVSPANADIVRRTVPGQTDVWLAEGEPHVFVLMGQQKQAYREKIRVFLL